MLNFWSLSMQAINAIAIELKLGDFDHLVVMDPPPRAGPFFKKCWAISAGLGTSGYPVASVVPGLDIERAEAAVLDLPLPTCLLMLNMPLEAAPPEPTPPPPPNRHLLARSRSPRCVPAEDPAQEAYEFAIRDAEKGWAQMKTRIIAEMKSFKSYFRPMTEEQRNLVNTYGNPYSSADAMMKVREPFPLRWHQLSSVRPRLTVCGLSG
jgi:hypothetical protein